MGDEIVKILNALCEKFGIVMNWSSQNVVPYIQLLSKRCVNYEIGTSIMWLVIGVFMLYTSYWLFKNVCLGKEPEGIFDFDEWDTIQIISWITAFIFVLFAPFIIGKQIYDIITCFTFPEKIIFNQITNIYKSLK